MHMASSLSKETMLNKHFWVFLHMDGVITILRVYDNCCVSIPLLVYVIIAEYQSVQNSDNISAVQSSGNHL